MPMPMTPMMPMNHVMALKAELRIGTTGVAQYMAAHLAKEAVKALVARDPEIMKDAVLRLKEPRFLGSTLIYAIVARLADKALMKASLTGKLGIASQAIIPMTLGMAAASLVAGHGSLRDFAIGTGAYLAAGTVVGLLLPGGPTGIMGAIVTTVKLAAMLSLGEFLEDVTHRVLDHKNDRNGLMDAVQRMATQTP
ncbi:MAG: hypothetical protein HYY16_18945 [Planctomycetes bacterium]|nr:hypothetical protein [Planctomycetota bacterium]